MPADPRRAKELFVAAVDLPDPPARAAFLDRECARDPDLRRRLDALLAAHDAPELALERPLATTVDRPGPAEQAGRVIDGKYKLLEPIGEGGMGEVWVADQLEPIRRRVALKVIKAGMDTRSVLARFEAERQALALMDHPNIAKVLDAGTTADGRPFFVMELVRGTPITQFCDARKLSPRERLELFVPVCQAIQHAHTKGIIHRDVKPSNVLVAQHDKKPVPKVIDFGVAKAVGQQLTEKTLYTGFGALVGTPAYMAPEQATFNQLDVDTRADVYALGVLAYELLAGSPPFEPERLRQAALDEVLRLVREEEPPKPSARISTSAARASIAAVRQSDPARLSKLVRGDLDWIVMKALEKDRTRRYETAAGLARDVQRYLADEPVEAGPPTATYRLRKFARRHRAGLAVCGGFVAVLAAGLAGSVWQAVRATGAERQAADDRDRAVAAERATADALDSLTDLFVQSELAQRPDVGAREREFMGRVAALYTRSADRDADPSRTADRYWRLASFQFNLGWQADALASARRALALREQVAANAPGDRAAIRALGQSSASCGWIAMQVEAPDAEPLLRRGVQTLVGLSAADPADPDLRHDLYRHQINLYAFLVRHDRRAEAGPVLEEAARLIRGLSNDFPDRGTYRAERAATLIRQANHARQTGARADVIGLYREAVAEFESIRPADLDTETRVKQGHCYHDFGLILSAARQPQEAAEFYGKATRVFADLAARFPADPEYRFHLAVACRAEGELAVTAARYDAAEAALAQAVALGRQLRDQFPELRRVPAELARSAYSLGGVHLNQGRAERAIDLYAEAIRAAAAIPAGGSEWALTGVRVYQFHWARAKALERLNRGAEADADWRTALALAAPDEAAAVRANLAVIRARAGRFAEALEAAGTAVAGGPRGPGVSTRYSAACVYALAADDPTADPSTRRARVERAVALLRAAVPDYFTQAQTVVWMLRDPDLAPLRTEPEFRRLVVELSGRFGLPPPPEPGPPPRQVGP
jgi:serine/threonine protein kinase/tetratricopeptide (TPR) repeat protein